MALFQVSGWDLKNETVAVGGMGQKKKSNREKKRERQQTKELEKSQQVEDVAGQEASIVKETEEPKKEKKKTKKEKITKKRKREESEKSCSTASSAATIVDTTVDEPLPITTQKLTPLQQKMMAKLSGSRFRWINEQLYTISSEEALSLLKSQPSLFDEYHQGFRSQVQSWPENPVDVFVDQIKTRASQRPINAPGGLPGLPDKKVVVADMGCGEAQLASDVNNFVKQYNADGSKKKFSKGNNNKRSQTGPKILEIEVHSFDLKKHNDRITVADIKNVPLPDGSCTVVIFCLALMGTNFLDFIKEAYRLLSPRGELWIAEIKSRFTESSEKKTVKPEDVGQEFVESLKLCGFFHKKTDNDNKMFTRFEFFKPPQDIVAERNAKLERRKKFIEQESEKEDLESKRVKYPEGKWLLKPCIYKRR